MQTSVWRHSAGCWVVTMADPKVYRLERIVDILQVPVEKREQCMRKLLYALDLADFTGAELAGPIEWADDGDMSSVLVDKAGVEVAKLEIDRG